MARFRKLRGTHFHKAEGERVAKPYGPGDILEIDEEYLRRIDPQLKSWEKLKDIEAPFIKTSTAEVIEKPTIVTEVSEEIAPKKITRTKAKFIKISIDDPDGDHFDVVSEKSGKKINDFPLTEEEADTLLAEATEPKK